MKNKEKKISGIKLHKNLLSDILDSKNIRYKIIICKKFFFNAKTSYTSFNVVFQDTVKNRYYTFKFARKKLIRSFYDHNDDNGLIWVKEVKPVEKIKIEYKEVWR